MAHTPLKKPVFELKSDSRARSRAVAVGTLQAGCIVLVEPPLAVALTQKTRRCDECLREFERLQKCSGCAAYFYCGSECQTASWKKHHRRLCTFAKSYTASEMYKNATEDARADVFLLAQLAAEYLYKATTLDDARNASLDTFWDLLTSNSPDQSLIPALSFTSPSVLFAAGARFGNNNFVVHDARLVPYAHGVFASASRSFNHSCRPNAAAMFEPVKSGIRMVVKLLDDVADGEEICISYTDPASRGSQRRDALLHAYGFSCHCPRCARESSTALPTLDPAQLQARIETVIEARLLDAESSLDGLRDELESLLPLVDDALELLPGWTAEFSRCAHDGPYDVALRWGNAVLGVYVLVYPGIHPLLELHCLELSKVAWNHYLTSVGPRRTNSARVKGVASTYLHWAKRLGDRLHEGLETSRTAIASEYHALEDCLREE